MTFCFWVPSNLSKQKCAKPKKNFIYFLGTIVQRKYLPKSSAVWALFLRLIRRNSKAENYQHDIVK